jgi:hypothetical protein
MLMTSGLYSVLLGPAAAECRQSHTFFFLRDCGRSLDFAELLVHSKKSLSC